MDNQEKVDDYKFEVSDNIAEIDAFTDSVVHKDVFQTAAWAKVSAAKGWKRQQLFSLVANGRVVVAAIAYLNHSKYFGNYIYIQHGPLVIAGNDVPAASAHNWGEAKLSASDKVRVRAFLHNLRTHAEAHNCFAIVLEPLATATSDLGKQIYAEGYLQQPRSILPRFPMFMDLNLSKEELLAKLDKKTRYNINYASRKGVSIQYFYPEVKDGGLDYKPMEEFYALLKGMSTRKDFDIPVYAFFKTAWEEYAGTKGVGIVAAVHDGNWVSANFSQFYENWAGSYYTANSITTNKLQASYLLKWQSILEAQRNGAKVFDMWGRIPHATESHPEYGYGKFKRSFAPLEKDFCGRVIYPVAPLKFKLWKFIGELRYGLG